MKNFKTIRNICLIVLSVLACTAVINLVRINATAGGNASATVKPLSSATNTVCTHKNEKILLSRAATCTQTGWTQGKECADCGELLLPQTTIAALGHTEEYVNEVKATCTQTGNTSGTKCTVCGVMTGPGGKELPIDPTNHQIRTV